MMLDVGGVKIKFPNYRKLIANYRKVITKVIRHQAGIDSL